MSDNGPPLEMQPDLVGTSLAPQLGSDRKEIDQGTITLPRLAVIKPELQLCFVYAGLRGTRGSTTWSFLRRDLLDLSIGVNGRGRTELIKMEIASRGGSVNPEQPDAQPKSWIERNVTDRKWAQNKLRESGQLE